MLSAPRPPRHKKIHKSGDQTNAHRVFRYKSNGWPPERRLKQAVAIRRWRPWARSTGPRTAEGKKASRHNGLKHGRRSGPWATINRLLREQRDFQKSVRRALRLGLDPSICITPEIDSWSDRVLDWSAAFHPLLQEAAGRAINPPS